MNLLEAVEHWAHATPNHPVHESSGRTLSYADLYAGAQAVARHIAQHELSPGTPVLVSAHKEAEALIAFVGAGLSGHPYVPLDSGLPESRRTLIQESANSPLTLDAQSVARVVAEGGAFPRLARPHDQVQYVMFTSGSTGRPKGVPITRGNLAEFQRWLLAEQRFTQGHERILDQAVYSFDLSVMSVFPAILTGGTLVSITREDLADLGRLFRSLASSRITTWVSTPSFAQLCLHEPRFGAGMLPGLERFLFCGETLPAATVRTLLDRFPGRAVWNTYGPTEATVAATSVEVDRALTDRFESLPIGRIGEACRARVVTSDFKLASPGERGEILITGPQVSPGYLGAPELTARAFLTWEGGWAYRTGDLGHEDSGYLFFDGRNDDQIKLNGFRIELGDIEANLASLPGVHAAAVIVNWRAGSPESLTGFVVLDAETSRSGEDPGTALKATLGARLPSYMVPRRIRVLERLPMTPNGKVDRRVLAELRR